MGGTKWLELGDVEWPLCSWHCTRHFLDITSHLSDRFTDGILLMRKPGLTEIVSCFSQGIIVYLVSVYLFPSICAVLFE